jgi:hypothetical protein
MSNFRCTLSTGTRSVCPLTPAEEEAVHQKQALKHYHISQLSTAGQLVNEYKKNIKKTATHVLQQ